MNTNTNIATVTDITAFVKSAIPMPEVNTQAIDTSNVNLLDYRSDDNDIMAVTADLNWQSIKLVDANGEVVPHARLELTYKSGKKIKIVPFFPLILMAKRATMNLTTEKLMEHWAENGSLKQKGGYRFVASKDQLEAIAAKAQMNYESTISQTVNSFISWLGDYQPVIAALPTLFTAYQAKATLVQLGEHVYIRQVIPTKDTETKPLAADYLVQANKPSVTKIGETAIDTAYTFRLELPTSEENA